MAKKRANGEGNIRKRKDGRWEGRYSAGYDSKTGKRIVKSVLGRTQAEVKEKLKTAIEETKGLDVSRSEEYTVATWLRTWHELYAKPNIRVATADRYQLMIETYTIPHPSHRRHQAKETDLPAPAEALQGSVGKWPGQPEKRQGKSWAQQHDCPQRPSDAPLCLPAGSQRAADPSESHRGLYRAEGAEN